MGQTAADPSTDAEADTGSLPQISARIGSLKDGRFDLLPFGLIRDTELRGVARGLCLPLPDNFLPHGVANGQPSRLGVPGVVKSRSRFRAESVCDLLRTDTEILSLSAEGPLHIFTPVFFAGSLCFSNAITACLIRYARVLRSPSSFCESCSSQSDLVFCWVDVACSRLWRKLR